MIDLKIKSITKIYNAFNRNKSVKEIHKELYDTTFKEFYIPLEFKRVILEGLPKIKKRIVELENQGAILLIPLVKFDIDKKRSAIFHTIENTKIGNEFYYHAIDKAINNIAKEYEIDEKNKMLEKDTKHFLDAKKHFVLFSRHDDCAKDHFNYQGTLAYINNVEKTQSELDYIKQHNLKSFEYLTGSPVWMITRPNCRHYYDAVSIDELQNTNVIDLLLKKDLVEKGEKTIKHNTQEYWYSKENIEHLIKKYETRLELHKKMNKTFSCSALKHAITKDKLLIDKWKSYLKEKY